MRCLVNHKRDGASTRAIAECGSWDCGLRNADCGMGKPGADQSAIATSAFGEVTGPHSAIDYGRVKWMVTGRWVEARVRSTRPSPAVIEPRKRMTSRRWVGFAAG